MTKVEFKKHSGLICGFDVGGHAGYDREGSDVACAAISSAVMMTVNGITEVVGAKAEVFKDEEKAYVHLMLDKGLEKNVSCEILLFSLYNHVAFLEEEFPGHIKLTCTEV